MILLHSPIVLGTLLAAAQGALDEPAPLIELPPIFADGMVLQRETSVAVWGAANPGVEVRLGTSWSTSDVVGVAGADGRWRVEVETPAASGPHALVASSGDGAEFVARDVWIGEVWVAAGQSNMAWTLGPGVGPGTAGWREEVARANLPLVRSFRVEQQVAWAPREVAPSAGWVSVTPRTAGGQSAVAYYFARRLWEELGVPIGIVEVAWSDTRIEAWTSAEALSHDSAFAAELERMAAAAADPGAEERRSAERSVEWMAGLERIDPGRRERWTASAIESHDWRSVDLPTTFAEHGERHYDGVVWYRRTFRLADEWLQGRAGGDAAASLSLGPIDDRDTVWVNGVRIGGLETAGSHATPRRYPLPPGLLRAGSNTLAIRVLDTGGVGGLTGARDDFFVERADGARVELAGRGLWRRGASLFELPPVPPASWLDEQRPSAVFNGMLAPWIGYGTAGILWYQGESNRLSANRYATRFQRALLDWRARWGRGDLPVYFVQIAPYAYPGDRGEAAELREAQAAALRLPATGMVTTTDSGDPKDIHPANKRVVGERLANLALARTYGRTELDVEPPRPVGWQADGAELRLVLDEPIRFHGSAPGPFYLAGEDRLFRPATARVEGGAIVLSSPLVPRPIAARFAWGAADRGDLTDAAGLPAAPFRTDDWPSVLDDGPAFDPR
ncbi:MAG: sialate O-acetylesterase [Planctomycetota bacterium]